MLNDTASYLQKLKSLFGSSIVALWPQFEPVGSTVSQDIGGRNHPGAYTAVTLGQPGIGDGNTAASFDGTTSFNNVYSVGLNTDFNGQEFTAIAWIKVSAAGVWTDATLRDLVRLRVDANNDFLIQKPAANNTIQWFYTAGGTVKLSSSNTFSGLTNFLCLCATVSKTNDAFKFYSQGIQLGSALTGLGSWTGSLTSNVCVFGAGSTVPAQVWSGSIGPVLLLNRAATAAEIAAASSLN
jgi:hypothetical protein